LWGQIGYLPDGVAPNPPAAVFWCSVARQTSRPVASKSAATTDGLHVGPTVATALITMDVGMAGVSGLLITECKTDKDWSPFGVPEPEAAADQIFGRIKGVEVDADVRSIVGARIGEVDERVADIQVGGIIHGECVAPELLGYLPAAAVF